MENLIELRATAALAPMNASPSTTSRTPSPAASARH
jgi:hypothetical protein